MKKTTFALTILSFAITILLSGCGTTDINIGDYTSVEYTGYNGDGEAEAIIDYDGLYDAILMASGDKTDNLRSVYPTFIRNTQYVIDKDTGLTNGDEVTVQFSGNEDAFKKAGVHVKMAPVQMTVAGLKEYTHCKAEDVIEVNQTGAEPYITLSYAFASSAPQELQGYVDMPEREMVKGNAGETIERTIHFDEDGLKSQGIIIDDDNMEITLESDGQYVTDVSDIPEDDLNQILSDTYDEIYAACKSDVKYNGTLGQIIMANGHELSFSVQKTEVIDEEISHDYALYYIKDIKMNDEELPKNTLVVTYQIPIDCVPTDSNFYNEVEFTANSYYVCVLTDIELDKNGKLTYNNDEFDKFWTKADYDLFMASINENYAK